MRSRPVEPSVPELDARGLRCPLPVVAARRRLAAMPPSARLDLLADDPLARLDVQSFCAREGHVYLGDRDEPGGGWRMALRRGLLESRE